MTDDDGTVNYYYDDDNRLVSEGGNELDYNDNGNLIQKTDENGTTNYSYDAAGRLSNVSVPNGTSVNYNYDAYGRKIFQEETNWQYTGKNKQLRSQTTSYYYRGETLLKEYTGEGSPLAEYYSANGRVIARNMFGFHDRKTWGNADTIRTRGGLMYYQYDALGNVTDFTDHLGDNVVKYRWDAFGGMFAGVLAPYSRMGITGKEYDPKTGQVFFGSRWYNPMVGQFTMPDTFMGQINKPQSLNAYAYAWNNPVNRTDPTGHWIDNGNGTYTAESGDTLWGLAQQTTGDGSNWTNLGYTGTPENLQVGETVGTSSGGTSSGGTSSGDTTSGGTSSGDTTSGGTSSGGTSTGDTSSGGTPSGNDNGGSSSGGGGSSGGGSYTPPPPPPEGGDIPLPSVSGPTLMEAADIADNVYSGNKGDTTFGGWTMVLDPHTNDSGLRMGVYGRAGADGKMEYVIANAGTDPKSIPDIENDLLQPFGASVDIRDSLKYAKNFVDNHSDANITFVGHSKGGAEAAANAVRTNRNAILFNPATVNLEAYGLDSSTYSGEMTAYIVKGEILNNVFGPISKPIGDVVYLPTQYPVNTWNPILNTKNSFRNHSMSAVKQAINEYEEE